MAQPQLLQIKLSRCDAQPWGFRLQGGVDFAQPLLVQKVNASSLSEQAGMQPGDAVIKINDVDVFNLRHKDAQDIVVRSGNNFVITVQRGGTTWRPHVTPTGNMPQANSPHLQTVTKTSLAHHQPDSQHIGCGYNNSARPFDNGGSDSGVKSIVNKQYNSPVGIYSDESIAETLSAQAEVLAGGVLGVNFKKNEKEYQGDRSEVLKFLREEETEQSTPAFNNNHSSNEHDAPQQQHLQQHHNEQQRHQKQHQHYSHQQQQSNTNSATRHVSAPINTPKPPSTGGLPSGQNICTECERLITGVFVRIKDKNLHVECFKCATCGTSLKNQGYYNFNNKLYCEIHAKQAAQQHPPAGTEGYVPVPIKPNTKLSATTISSALNYHCFGSNGYNGANGNSSSAPAPVNQGYARPYGASQPPVAAPKSPVPVSYPPQHQHQSSYATLPRSNVCQQVPSSYAPFAKPNNLHANTNVTMPRLQQSADNTPSQKLNAGTDVDKDIDATALLAHSISNFNIGKQRNAFLQESCKIISNMLEARLTNGSPPPAHSNSIFNQPSNSVLNVCKSQMIVSKRLDLDDFREMDPTQPVVSETVEPSSHQKSAVHALGNQIAEPQVRRMEKTLLVQHPMGKTHDMLGIPKTKSTTPVQQTPEPVAFRNNLQRAGATNAADRRSYIEPKLNSSYNNDTNEIEKTNSNNCQLNATNLSVCVSALDYAMRPMSKENEKAVSQLLKNGKRPVCCHCNKEITLGPFITALGRIWCPDHFICVNGNCRRPLQDIGFVEEKGDLYCEYCFEKFLAPSCSKCARKIKGDCLNAIGKHFHPECFTCGQCGKIFGNTPFFLEDGNAYCEADWNELFTTKCFACGFPVEAGDRWVEALSHNYHSQCFNCTFCKQNLEGQSFYNKGGRPFCKNHAR